MESKQPPQQQYFTVPYSVFFVRICLYGPLNSAGISGSENGDKLERAHKMIDKGLRNLSIRKHN